MLNQYVDFSSRSARCYLLGLELVTGLSDIYTQFPHLENRVNKTFLLIYRAIVRVKYEKELC